MENDLGNIGKAMTMKTAPPLLEQQIMEKIIQLDRRRSLRKFAWLLGVKIFSICTILILLGSAIWRTFPGWHELVEMKQIPNLWDEVLSLLKTNSMYVIPVVVVLILCRIFLGKLER
ncbi:MAG TPA: hypothetical protein VFV08_10235 [Puia sp.]|nr:hypothetical protein [Puia sp.]